MIGTTSILRRTADASTIEDAAQILRHGGLVAFPTETVYGLGADARNGEAVARIFEVKGRPRFNPLIVHVRDVFEAEAHGEFAPIARKLATAFWPGALTLVLRRKESSAISLLVSAGLETVALRVPSHPVAMRLLECAGIPIAAPSANLAGHVTSTDARHVTAEFGDRIDLVVDGGVATIGLESTVVGFERGTPVMLRAGAIDRSAIESIAGPVHSPSISAIQSPGQLASHYAPRATVRLNATEIRPGEALLAFGDEVPQGGVPTLNLSRSGDLREAATNFFAMLRALDASGVRSIAVMPLPATGLGEALNDRLSRAAAPRAGTQ